MLNTPGGRGRLPGTDRVLHDPAAAGGLGYGPPGRRSAVAGGGQPARRSLLPRAAVGVVDRDGAAAEVALHLLTMRLGRRAPPSPGAGSSIFGGGGGRGGLLCGCCGHHPGGGSAHRPSRARHAAHLPAVLLVGVAVPQARAARSEAYFARVVVRACCCSCCCCRLLYRLYLLDRGRRWQLALALRGQGGVLWGIRGRRRRRRRRALPISCSILDAHAFGSCGLR